MDISREDAWDAKREWDAGFAEQISQMPQILCLAEARRALPVPIRHDPAPAILGGG